MCPVLGRKSFRWSNFDQWCDTDFIEIFFEVSDVLVALCLRFSFAGISLMAGLCFWSNCILNTAKQCAILMNDLGTEITPGEPQVLESV